MTHLSKSGKVNSDYSEQYEDPRSNFFSSEKKLQEVNILNSGGRQLNNRTNSRNFTSERGGADPIFRERFSKPLM